MLEVEESRGWFSDENTDTKGANNSYYLYSEEWYRLISPCFMQIENRGFVFRIHGDGGIGFQSVDYAINSGVQKVLQKDIFR